MLIASMSVKGLFYCDILLVFCCCYCLWHILGGGKGRQMAKIIITVSGIYYGVLLTYMIIIINKYSVSFFPNIGFFLPALVIQMMVLLLHEAKQAQLEAEDRR